MQEGEVQEEEKVEEKGKEGEESKKQEEEEGAQEFKSLFDRVNRFLFLSPLSPLSPSHHPQIQTPTP